MKITILVLACLVTVSSATLAFSEDELEKDLIAGDEAKLRWDYPGAISCYSRAIEKDPLCVAAYAARACMYTRTGELDRAMSDASRAVQLDPQFGPGYFARALAFFHRGETAKAISDLSEAIRLEPDAADFISMRGEYYWRQGDVEKAIADYDRAAELDPDNPVNFCARGDLRVMTGDYARAVSDYQRAQQLKPDYEAPYISYAWLLATCPDVQWRDGARALEYAKIALDLNPKREDGWAVYAAALAAVGKFDKAVEWQQRYAASKVLNESSRVQAESMVSLYKSHQPYIAPYPRKPDPPVHVAAEPQ